MTINPNWYQPNLYERDLFTPGEAVRFATELSQLLVADIADEPTVTVEYVPMRSTLTCPATLGPVQCRKS